MRKHALLCVGVAAALLGLAGCGAGGDEAAQDPTSTATATAAEAAPSASGEATAPEMPEPDLEGIPDVVAVVNGEEITRDQFVEAYENSFTQYAMQAQMAGQPVDQDLLKAQTADTMVNTRLLRQEADERGITAAPEDVDATLDELAEANELESVDGVFEMLAEQGYSEEEVRAEVENQVILEQLVADEAGDTTPTDEEIQALYDDVVAQQEEAADAAGQEAATVPPLEDVRPQVEEQLRSQKESEAVQALLASLRESGDVTINLP